MAEQTAVAALVERLKMYRENESPFIAAAILAEYERALRETECSCGGFYDPLPGIGSHVEACAKIKAAAVIARAEELAKEKG